MWTVPEAEILSQSYEGFLVEPGEAYRLRGTVVGNVEVLAGGKLIHEGCIAGKLYVHAGGSVYVRGVLKRRMYWDRASDVTFHGFGQPAPGGIGPIPDTHPDGWGALDAAWAKGVPAIERLVRDLQDAEDSTDYAFRAAVATIGLTGRSDAALWALIAAAVFNNQRSLQLPDVEERWLWSPHDCRTRIPWAEFDGYFDAPPEPFAELLPLVTRAGRSLAFDYYEALSQLIRAVLAIGDPPRESVARVEAFRAMLRQQSSSPPRRSPPAKPRTGATGRSRPKNPPKAPARPRATGTRAGAGSGEARREAAIRRQTDPVDAALTGLDGLIGLESVKEEVQQLGGFAYIERQRVLNGEPPAEITRHLVMTGNPGTGKTTVAHLLGEIYCAYGLLDRPTVREVTRSDLVAGYVGQTAPKMRQVFNEARGGVLFIDEAYSLAPEYKQDFGQEAIDTLVPLMENHRSEIMVVVAGYPEPMRRFLGANPGLDGRFGQKIHFPNYSDAELLQILRRFCDEGGFDLTKGAERASPAVIRTARERMGPRFDNARMMRRLFEAAVKRHHARVYRLGRAEKRRTTRAELRELTPDDLPTAEQLVPDAEDAT